MEENCKTDVVENFFNNRCVECVRKFEFDSDISI